MLKVLLYVLPFAALLYALLDLRRSEPFEREGLPLWGWVAVIVVLPVVGPIVWVVVSTSRRREARPGPSRRPGGGGGGRRPGGPGVAPDDDPDFLWRLEQERRRQEKDRPEQG